ncbi:uncharacterized protein BT62DRAFT_1013348 [Guyanagaster necrorhizus]|uniref:F-box domain-containing protein n=1 Tax=Guyanagaster necrorhizus TaxID=856835 RepID=A0A9P7VG12_9AGAR|nr:uncharacterized protein BT62DRAFT_1013348 [Guyanagaster necrorhizus MCA 3950]KAG7439898.1 hypothetical protein BT62DRAFT_1013348 [Guyanagaster necrorhizus MCA 3950]
MRQNRIVRPDLGHSIARLFILFPGILSRFRNLSVHFALGDWAANVAAFMLLTESFGWKRGRQPENSIEIQIDSAFAVVDFLRSTITETRHFFTTVTFLSPDGCICPVSMMSPSDMSFIEERRPAPIDRLFVEILIYIFHMSVLDRGSYFEHFDVIDYQGGPWKLGQICSPWRQIANNTSTLFKVTLERSSCLPLDLRLFLSYGYPLEVKSTIYQLAIAQSWRWEHLTITPDRDVLPFLSDIPGCQLNKLSHLTVHCHELRTPQHIDAFQDPPALRTVELLTNSAGDHFELPWNNIVAFFDYTYWGFPEHVRHVIDVIQQCANLQILHMQLLYFSPSEVVSITPPFRSSLRDLTACQGAIFRSVILPQLEKIRVVPSANALCPDDALPDLPSLLQCLQCSLVSLELVDVIFTDIIFHILHCTPHINTLKLSTQCWATGYDRIFKALIDRLASHPSTQQSFLPLLRNLHITIDDVFINIPCAFVDHVFFDMVSSRWNTRILSAVTLDMSEPGKDLSWGLTQEHIKEFRKYQKDGLGIKLGVLRVDREAEGVSFMRKRYV